MKHLLETPYIEVGGIELHEPGSIISNTVLAIVCLAFYFVIRKKGTSPVYRNWSLFMLGLGLSSAGGVFTHGFPTVLPFKAFWAVWAIKNSFINIGMYYGVMGAMHGTRFENLSWLKTILLLKAGVAILLTTFLQNFLPTAIDIGTCYLLIILFAAVGHKAGVQGTSTLLWGFIVMFLSGFLFLFKIGVSDLWFNHNDLAHVFAIFTISMVLVSTRNLQISGTP